MDEIPSIIEEIEAVVTKIDFDQVAKMLLHDEIVRLSAYYRGTRMIPEQDVAKEKGVAAGMLMGLFSSSLASVDDKHRLDATLRGWLSRA